MINSRSKYFIYYLFNGVFVIYLVHGKKINKYQGNIIVILLMEIFFWYISKKLQ
jgi:hypothetical protein